MAAPAASLEATLAAMVEQAVSRAVAPLVAELRALRGSAASSLTTDQAAEALGVTPKTLRGWAAEGRIEGTKRGREWRFTPEQVEAARDPAKALADDAFRRLG